MQTRFPIGILFLFILFFIACQERTTIDLSAYEPWRYTAEAPAFNREYSRQYMNTRPPRISEDLNYNWTFLYSPESREDTGYIQAVFNDETWEAIQLPHTWMCYETTGDMHPFIMHASESEDAYWWKGWGYYRKKIGFDPSLKGKRFFLEFDGVQKYSAVYVNGMKAGEHKGGFNSFSIDISPFLDWNREFQQIAVSVNGYRRDKWKIPPMTAGNWNVYSGIYRPVHLVVKNEVHIPFQGNSEHEGGTFVTTPWVKADSAIVQIATYIKNSKKEKENIRLLTQIIDPGGKLLLEMSDEQTVFPDSICRFTQSSPKLGNLQVWSDRNPVLYKVKSLVYVQDSLSDNFESPLGIRNFHWDYTTNELYVNGAKINIRGTNRHQEYPWLGDAIPEWISLKDMQDIRYGLGINFMRTAHYPQAPVVYDFNNQNGIITVEEVPNIKNIEFNDEVQEQNARAMVRRDRNNPSIFFWSVGNETSDAANSAWIWEEDKTRIIHARKAEGGGEYVQHTHLNLDMENLLRVTHRGWFAHEDAQCDTKPDNGQEAGSNLWQYESAKTINGSIRGNLNRNCVAWLYQDHGADRNYNNSLLTALNAKGWVDMYRVPKYIYSLTRANYTESPFISINSAFWRANYIGQERPVSVDSNCEDVELWKNNVLVGKQKIAKEAFNSVRFENVFIEEGELKAVGYRNGEPVASQILRMAGKPERIILRSTSETLGDDNERIAVITAYVVDEAGTVVFDTAPPLQWEVKGEARLVGPSLYENDLGKKEAVQGIGYEAIPVSNVIRGTADKGKVEVIVKSPLLKQGEISLRNLPVLSGSSLIRQPALTLKGRKRNVRDVQYQPSAYQFSQLIRCQLSENVHFPAKDQERLKKEISAFLMKQGDAGFFYGEAYDALIRQMISIVRRMNGLLIGDDFNFLMQQYNMYLNIQQVIDECMFHVDYAQLLKSTYLKKIMIDHEQLDFESTCEEILSYPRKHKVCYVVFNEKTSSKARLDYDYVTRTYTLATSRKTCYRSLVDALGVKKQASEVWEEIARITPGLSFNPRNQQISFPEREKILIVPEYN